MFKKASLVSAAVMAIATPLVMQQEGLVLNRYLDQVGVATYCYGETEGVSDKTYTPKECHDLLKIKLGYIAYSIDSIVEPELDPHTHAALSSWAYNVGMANVERSTLIKKLNKGDLVGACNELPRWVYAKGKKLNGLIKRREIERKLCLTT